MAWWMAHARPLANRRIDVLVSHTMKPPLLGIYYPELRNLDIKLGFRDGLRSYYKDGVGPNTQNGALPTKKQIGFSRKKPV